MAVLPVGNPPGGPWVLAFADEFDTPYPTPYGTGPNPNVWADHFIYGDMFRSQDSGQEYEWYPHGYYGHSVANSLLTLTAVKQNPQSIDPVCPNPLLPDISQAGQFTAGMISGHLGISFTYGYIEARVQFSPSIWGGFWMLTRNLIWPPEIDIAEPSQPGHSGQVDNAYYNIASQWQVSFLNEDSNFHVWGCLLTPTTVTYYMDGVQTNSFTYDGHAFAWYPIVSQALPSGGTPGSCNIDYIRQWVTSGVPSPPAITSITPSTGIPSGGNVTVAFTAVAGATSYRVTASAKDAMAAGWPNNVGEPVGIGNQFIATGSGSPLTVTGIPAGVAQNFTVCAINSTGYSIESAPFGPQVVNIQLAAPSLPNGTTGIAYSQALTATAGFPPYAWSISSGALPAGLTLSTSTGVISGTPTAAGTFGFTVKVSGTTAWTGSSTVANSASAAVSITISGGSGPPPPPPPSTWTLVASENFSTNTLSTNFAVYNNGTATSYEANSWMSSQVTVNTSTQQLLMNAKGSGGERVGGAWQWLGAGGVANQLYGAWEIDYYTQNGAGYWPVLLMWPNAIWPVDGEIDIFEDYNQQPPVATHIGGTTNLHLNPVAGNSTHFGMPNARSNSTPGNVSAGDYQIDLSSGPNANGTHTVRLEWQQTYVAVYVDGTQVSRTTDMSWIPTTKAMVLTLQQEFYGTNDSSVPSLNANTVVTGLRAYTYSGSPFIAAPMSNLSDNFATNDLSSLWSNTDSGVTVSGNAANIPSTTSYYQLGSGTAYNLTGSSFSAKISPSTSGGSSTDLNLCTGIQIINFSYSGGTLSGSLTQGEGTVTNVGSTSYNSTNHAYWKISESGGTLTWAASPDGVTWTTLWTHTYTMNITVLMCQIQVGQGSGTGSSTTVSAVNPGGGTAVTSSGTLALAPFRFSGTLSVLGGTLRLPPFALSGTVTVPIPQISLVQHAQASSASNTATVTLAPTGAGNALIVAAAYGYAGSDSDLTSITLGGSSAGWASQLYFAPVNLGDVSVWGNFNIPAGQTTLVVTTATGHTPMIVDVYEVNGLQATLALDVTSTQEVDSTGSTFSSNPTGALSQNSEFVVGVVNGYTPGSASITFTGPSSWSNQAQQNQPTTITELSGYTIISGSTAAQAYSGTMNLTSGVDYAAAVATFRGVIKITSSGSVSLQPLGASGLVNTGRAGSIAVDGVSPPVVALTNTRATSLVTASFTPPANTMLAVLASFEYQTTGSTAPVLTVTDSASGTWITGPSVYDGISANAAIWTQYLYNSETITVTLNVTAVAAYGAILAVYVLDGPASIQGQTGHATATPSVPTTGWSGNITTTKIGSWVMIAASGAAQASVTPSGITTLYDLQDSVEGASLLTARQATATTVPGVTPLGWTSSVAGSFAWAALEIVPAIPVIRPATALARTAVRQASLY